ncbi:LamG domain-containing protein [Arenimonas fontis]|nr:LamG domain-containing protein [Arenimonas fontis]
MGLLGAATPRAGGGAVDPDWASRVALLHFDGANGSTSFADEKLGGNWSGSGNAQISTAQSRYGGASLLLDGTGDWVETSHTAAWAFGSGDFFVEASIRIPNTTGAKTIISQWGTATGDRAWTFYVNGSTLTLAVWPGPAFASANGVTANAWHDVACGRIGNTIYVWLNGTRSGTTGSYTGTLPNPSSVIRIGADSNGNNPYTGHIDEVRVSALSGPNGNYTPSYPFLNGP